jgi:hypothetical protein
MELIIVQGKGLGQIRRMSAQQNLGGNPAIVRFTVSPPWDVPPDNTSFISAGSWHVNNVFYRNIARGSKSPYNVYYGGCYDCVDADAVSENTEGWNNWGRIGEFPMAKPGIARSISISSSEARSRGWRLSTPPWVLPCAWKTKP